MNNIKYQLLRIWTFIKIWSSRLYRLFVHIDEVKVFNIFTSHHRARFFLIKIIQAFINLFKRLRDSIDFRCEAVSIKKNINGQNRTVIYEDVRLSDAVVLANEIRVDDTMQAVVYLEFGFNDNDMKYIFTKYKDTRGSYGHTLKNILALEGVDYNLKDNLHLRKITKGKIQQFDFVIDDVINEHINYFRDL